MPSDAIGRNLAILQGTRAFQGIPQPHLAEFAREATTAALSHNELLWHTGQPALSFTIIVRGVVLIQKPLPSGTETIVGLFGPRECVGIPAVVERSSYPANAVVASPDAEMLRVPAQRVLGAMDADPSVARAIQQALLDHGRALQAKIDIVSAGSVSARLAMLMLHLAERFGDDDDESVTHICLPLSRGALSHMVSARVETVIRMLSAWDKQGLLHTRGDSVEIPSLKALRAIANQG